MINDEVPGERIFPGPKPPPAQFFGGGRGGAADIDLKRSPMIIWLNPSENDSPANPWKTGGPDNEGLEWGTDSVQDFADRLKESNYFDERGVPQPSHNDIIAGLDKNDVTVILKVTIPIPDGIQNEQEEAPGDFLA